MLFEALPNANIRAPSGAGIGAAQTIAQKHVEAVITGNLGPKASRALSQLGIQMITGVSGTVGQVVEDFKSGALKSSVVSGESFAGTGRGLGMGSGRGRGMGRGMSMQGIGRRSYSYRTTTPIQSNPPTREQEIDTLTKHMKDLERQLKEVKEKLEELK
jgi:predicted Fe-Mo cluster-binding NifX family protein